MLWLHRIRRSEEGSALIAGVTLSFVMMVLVTTIFAIWDHSNDATVRDRSRTQGLQSAEAAVATLIDGLTRNICVQDMGMGSPDSLTVEGGAVGQFQAIVRLPSEAGVISPVTWDPNDPTSAGCISPPAVQDRVITAWGYGPSAGSARRVLRKVEVVVRVAPLQGFRWTCFSGGFPPSGVLTIKNNMEVNGDCYARSISATFNNFIINGWLVTPGDLTTKNNAVYKASIWAGGSVVVGTDTTVTGYVTSATSAVTLLNGSQVLDNATAGTTITLGTGAKVHRTMCPATPGDPGCPSNPPPIYGMPITKCGDFDAACWTALYEGNMNTSHTSASLTSWLSDNRNNLQGQFYVNDPGGTIVLNRDSTITGPFTVVTTGKLDLSRRLDTLDSTTPPESCTPLDGPATCEAVFVSLNTAADAIKVSAPRFMANVATISLLLYTKGTVQADGGANPVQYKGSVYGSNLAIDSNGFFVTQSQDLIDHPPPFIDWTLSANQKYSVAPTAWREMTPEAP